MSHTDGPCGSCRRRGRTERAHRALENARAFSTSFHRAFPLNHPRKTQKGPKIALGNPDRPVISPSFLPLCGCAFGSAPPPPRPAAVSGACAVHCWCVALSLYAAETCSPNGAPDPECIVSAHFVTGCAHNSGRASTQPSVSVTDKIRRPKDAAPPQRHSRTPHPPLHPFLGLEGRDRAPYVRRCALDLAGRRFDTPTLLRRAVPEDREYRPDQRRRGDHPEQAGPQFDTPQPQLRGPAECERCSRDHGATRRPPRERV